MTRDHATYIPSDDELAAENPRPAFRPTGAKEHLPPTITYYDAETESYVTHEGEVVRSGLGWGPGPDYGIIYRLADGRYLGGVRHLDRGDLMTEIRYAKTMRGAMPLRWR